MAGYAINPGDHIDAPLSNYLAATLPVSRIADLVAPVVPVRRRTDKFYSWDKAAFLRTGEDQRRARGTRPRVIEPSENVAGYMAQEYELSVLIEDGDYANTDSVLRLEQAKAVYLQGVMQMGRETRVAAALRLAANGGQLGTSGSTLAGANQWDNGGFTAANLQRDIMVAREAVRASTGYDPNTIIIPKAVAAVVARNSDIKTMISYLGGIDYIRGAQVPGGGSAERGYDGYQSANYLPSTLFGLNVIEPGMVQNTAAEGAAASMSDVWGKDVRILYVKPGLPSMDVPSTMYTFRSTEYGTAGWNVRRWREEAQRGNYLAVGIIDDERVVATDMAYVYAAAIS